MCLEKCPEKAKKPKDILDHFTKGVWKNGDIVMQMQRQNSSVMCKNGVIYVYLPSLTLADIKAMHFQNLSQAIQ